MSDLLDSKSRFLSLSKDRYFHLLTVLVVIIAISPFLNADHEGAPFFGALMLASLILGIRAVAKERHVFWIALGMGIICYAISIQAFFAGGDLLISLPFQFAFFAYVTASITRTVLIAPRIDPDVVCGAITVYILLAITWALVYGIIELNSPGSIAEPNGLDIDGLTTPSDFLYFSTVTLTTLGYGDIIPVTKVARTATALEALTGTLFVAVFIGRLVGMTSLGESNSRPVESKV